MFIHPSHQPQARHAILATLVLLAALVLLAVLPASVRLANLNYAQPVHIALETLGILIGALIFVQVWLTRDEDLPPAMVVLACGFAGVALLDFSHTLSAADMPDFVTANSAEKSVLFSLHARTLGALVLLVAAVLSTRRAKLRLSPTLLLALVLFFTATSHLLILAFPEHLPRMLSPQLGLSSIKIGSHYVLAAANLLAAAFFFRQLREARNFSSASLFAAACIMAQSELLFTIYRNAGDLSNLCAHAYKLVAYGFLFQAAFVETVQRPYQLLRNSERQLGATLTALPDLLFELDGNGNFLALHSTSGLDGFAPAALQRGQNIGELMTEASRRTLLAALGDARKNGHSHGRVVELEASDGSKRCYELSVAAQHAGSNEEERFLVISRDVTERQQQARTLRTLSLAVEQSPASIIITDARIRIEYVNEAFVRTTGYPLDEVAGRHPRFLNSSRNPADIEHIIDREIGKGRHWRGELITVAKNGREFTESVLLYAVQDEDAVISHYLVIKEDISARQEAAERIRQLSNYDQLTGLPNRRLLAEHFHHLCADSPRIALLWIDLDHFKDINDALGHAMGDQLLQEIASRLRNALRVQDVLSRISGDDFVALLPDADQNLAAAMSRWLIDALAAPVTLGNERVSVGASIGIALMPDDATALETLLQQAEIAMYRMKESGRNDYSFFTTEMQDRAVRTLALSNALKLALSRDELQLVYQPQMDLANGRIIGAEALLRWHCPPWGEISPVEFIPIAETSGLMIPIGEWVLRTALRQLRCWHDHGFKINMAVNLSAVQFEHDRLPETINHLLQENRIAPQHLELELTEAVAMKAPEQAALRMEELSALGIRLAIDDFGTGYSSLSYLKRFKIHKLKIDQSFVRDLESDPDDCAIVSTIIDMAKNLGMLTIAEGVETAQQLSWLSNQACHEIQGYHLSPPLPAERFASFLFAQRSETAH